MDYSRWMGEISARIAHKPLNEILIPGAHDAGSYAITRQSEATPTANLLLKAAAATDAWLVEAWGKAQRVGLAEQFKRGIRYFDLRLYEKPGGELWLHHSYFSTPLVPELHALRELIRRPEYAREIVILEIPLVGGDHVQDHEAVASIVWDHFGGYLPDSQDTPTLGPASRVQDFWDAGRTVIAIYGNAAGNPPGSPRFLWDRASNVRSQWLNRQTWTELKPALLAELANRPAAKLWVAQALLTPNGGTIAKSILTKGLGLGGQESLFDLAAEVNPKVGHLLWEIATGGGATKRPNIVMTDFAVDVGDITELCVRINELH